MNKITPSIPFYLFLIGIFLIIISPDVLSEGMFMDGLIYSTVAHNLSKGLGTFWNPHFTTTCMADFHEHPPLAFGLHSIFFTILGDSRYVDKLYSLSTFVLVGYIIVKIWTVLKYKHSWVPLLLWLSIPLVMWASYSNILENTVSIFTSLSILFYLQSQNHDTTPPKILFISLSGFMLSLGFLTKGFVALFPWTFPFLCWFLLKRQSFRNTILDSIGIIILTVAPLFLLIMVFPEVELSLHKYIDRQVINSIKNIKTVDYRFFIVERLFSELAPAISIFMFLLIWNWVKKQAVNSIQGNIKPALLFILLGFTGVLPIMISMKQSGFYMLASLPFFAIGIGILIYPLIDLLFSNMNYQSKGFRLFKWIACGVFFTGILLSLSNANQIGRDKNKIQDTHTILSVLPEGCIINIYPNLWQDWSLHGYFGRYKNVSLDTNLLNKRAFLLIKKEDYNETIIQTYTEVELQTRDFKLLKKKL